MGLDKRDPSIDFLKTISIFLIIAAHLSPPDIFFSFRNFDVVLMIIISAKSQTKLVINSIAVYIQYLKKRFNRIIRPTWNFISIYFLIVYIISLFGFSSNSLNVTFIISSFLMIDGIGYVWIMRVLFTIAAVTPIIIYINNRIQSNVIYIVGYLILITFFSGYSQLFISYTQVPIKYILLESIGWILVFSLGFRLSKLSRNETKLLLIITFIIFIFLFSFNSGSRLQDYKYPPTLYYVVYGLFCSIMLMEIAENRSIKDFIIIPFSCFFEFVSKNSLTIYFWHIFIVIGIDILKTRLDVINSSFLLRFGLCLSLSLLFTYIQKCTIFNKNSYLKIIYEWY